MHQGCKIVGVIACRIDSARRWSFFVDMLHTIERQSVALDALFVGISYPSTAEFDHYQPLLVPIRLRMRRACTLAITQTKTTRTQGEMWNRMVQRFADISAENTWILFGDDDDLWHRERVSYYRLGLDRIFAQTEYPLSCFSDIRSNVCLTSEVDTTDVAYDDIDRHLQNGVLETLSLRNYWDHCIRGSQFCDFLSLSNDFMRKDPTFDVMLRTYIMEGGRETMCDLLTPPPGTWMYFWRRHDGACTNLRRQIENDYTSEQLRFAVQRQTARMFNFDKTVELCMSKWCIGANEYIVRRYAREYALNFPPVIQHRIGLHNRTIETAFAERSMSALHSIAALPELPSSIKEFLPYVDAQLYNACDRNVQHYNVARDIMQAVALQDGCPVDHSRLPLRARTFIEAFTKG